MHLLVSGNVAQVFARIAVFLVMCLGPWTPVAALEVTVGSYDGPEGARDVSCDPFAPKVVVVEMTPTTFRVGEHNGPALVLERNLELLRAALDRLKHVRPDRVALRIEPHDDIEHGELVAVIDLGYGLGYRTPRIVWRRPDVTAH